MTRAPLQSNPAVVSIGSSSKEKRLPGRDRASDSRPQHVSTNRDSARRQHVNSMASSSTSQYSTMARNASVLSNLGVPIAQGPVVPILTPEQMYSNFEEWIKMCTDNKVNASNSWNFALIDYFHEMTFIRDGDTINFQKASCTLDGCVKIYTSRVDSVASETGKLLSGLADSARDSPSADETNELQRDDANERRTRRRANRSETTLLKDFSSIALKKFDLDFTVDPLFKKTSADFDEGGARGLLLNHLSIDRECRIIFDASDTIAEQTSEADAPNENYMIDGEGLSLETSEETTAVNDEEEAVAEGVSNNSNEADDAMEVDLETNTENDASIPQSSNELASSSESSMVEISRLKAKLPALDVFQELNICPTLQGINFFADADFKMPNFNQEDKDDLENPVAEADDINPAFPDDLDDLTMEFDNDNDEILDGIDAADPFQNDDIQNNPETAAEIDDTGADTDNYIMAMMNNADQELFSYFDETLQKNWAGPEHWKLRRPVSKVGKPDTITEGEERTTRKTKTAFEIDFLNGEDVDEEEIFAVDKRVRITMPVVKDANRTPSKHLLPDDVHFSSKQLLRLFLKPRFTNDTRRNPIQQRDHEISAAETNNAVQTTQPDNDMDMGPDVQFWAEQELEIDAPLDSDNLETSVSPDDDMLAEPTQLSTYDDSAFYNDSMLDTYDETEPSALYGDALITNHRLNKVKPLYVNYARTAKRVDVKRLKDNLWKVLTTSNENGTVDTSGIDPSAEKVHGERRFTEIIQSLKEMYSPKTMKDISVSFCFICLLHLANEKNLSIVGNSHSEEDDDFVLGDDLMDEAILNEITILQNV
ncbi:condensin complex subunit 2/barren [Radiomyces spectabilis]|uniref:condensin complex subunit 2/barren n=1 Tax=Radiomyces spectabilis TaxID=64574 RepID=UPI00221F357E|nr:condensin complex subunit 2/barren [Radiomyces spectabilis]KAI8367476.1 condensin complex subunit 2/barren [Radiomyces spectabilis]